MAHRRRDFVIVLMAQALLLAPILVLQTGCGSGEQAAAPARGLLVAISKFEMEGGKPKPLSELLVLTPKAGAWQAQAVGDPESNVFHKAMVYQPPGEPPGILTLGGSAAVVKLWRARAGTLQPVQTLWKKDFGGKFSRMRDGEVAELYGDGKPDIIVATHDQGVVGIIRPLGGGAYQVQEIDHQKDTFVHEIEIGDLDHDGVPEVYASSSEPNRLDGKPQKGKVFRYVPARGEGRTLVADLGMRHAKEILVDDVDGDGVDELYVSIEAVEGGNLEIRRYDADTPPTAGFVIATLEDPMCRFLTAGDVDGDGKKELVLAPKNTGLWLARPGSNPRARWKLTQIDAHSKGFEHAALLTDLDGDGVDELYVANDDEKEIDRYVWKGGKATRETIYKRSSSLPVMTWNLMPVPVALVSPGRS